MGILKKMVRQIPPFKKLISQREKFRSELNEIKRFSPPGHFYSPIPDIDKVLGNESRIWKNNMEDIPGIDLNTEAQLKLLDAFEPYYQELPFHDNKVDHLRYYYVNGSYSYSDAILLYCMIRHLQPDRIIEVGSGFSSCVTLDTNELCFNNTIKIQFIEPYAELLKGLIKETDHSFVKIVEKELQEVPLDPFEQLKPNDILFIDSTHVAKIGSDVNYIIHNILPALSSGVYIHFHDVFFPFEYPKEWILEGRAWNEQYILRAFLQYNSKFEITLFNTYLEHLFEDRIRSKFPLLYKNTGGSIWIRKL